MQECHKRYQDFSRNEGQNLFDNLTKFLEKPNQTWSKYLIDAWSHRYNDTDYRKHPNDVDEGKESPDFLPETFLVYILFDF